MKNLFFTVSRQRGSAIISALLIAAIVAVIAAGMLTRQGVLTRSLEAEQSRVQGSQQLLGGLEISRQLLWDSRQQDASTRLDQPWARPIVINASNARPGEFEGQLQDQQGKFNLRNLLTNQQADIGQQRSFERLCEMIGIDAALAQRIIQRVIASYPRLLSTPMSTGPASSFDSGRVTSSGTEQTLLPATQPMLRSLEDLRGMAGLTEASLTRLDYYVSVLPSNTWVNGNTASAEVLAAVIPGLSLSRAQAVVSERDRGLWFVNRGDLINRLRVPKLTVDNLNVGVTSEWFMLRGQARPQQRQVRIQALLHRVGDTLPRVIWSRVGI
ncbi:type II secretion system minor pseudopilin GspK [Pseudomonas alliivorans]|nr:type II secretion system minor pseudopilin GspK [Pseudomonas alliivorans]MEE4915881.1 type II secretion system minor pseudopilin GspK [Pseudomonas alliivorans]MEE5101304.1 type II secretion system minor pseudopilin GspK [Pseudomonas alliivorans]MEE5132029.1 type II secretion system minor pseudopilin GspK [Pseudomonas alliivorans]